ncbi:uncharacterized protein LOC128390563 [Panonychus citri]|uniref:uncharacterized protein LOC128390563 n=1 Tax=Panonychus citri TaxID=50023 RepID=UPI002307051E|nr:uncharacterized protein LOC128390563 [Panonychus citri]
MNVMSGINRKLNQNEGRQIVDYINKRIEEKADMERRGIPFFKADSEAFESQDIKRLTILDKVFKTRTNPLKSKRVKEFKIARAHKPFWCELAGFMNMTNLGLKKIVLSRKQKKMIKDLYPLPH